MNAATPRWGWKGTVLGGVVVMAVFYATQMAFALVYANATMGNIGPERMVEELAKLGTNGDVIAVAMFLTTPAGLLAIVAIVMMKRGASFEDTLAIHAPRGAVLARWMLIAIAFVAVSDALTWLLGKPIVPPFMEAAYRSADGKAAFWIAVVLAAPVFEEVLFRGFLITGLAPSRLGASGAVIVTSLAWSAIHVQYDFYGIATIFLMGLLLGTARVKTGSLLVPIAMHMAGNAIATAEAALL